jgi:hypothetical protein
MRRTQLYLDHDLWTTLKAKAKRDGTTISDLARVAARDKYIHSREQRIADMKSVIGLWKERDELADTDEFIRNLRSDDRMERLEIECPSSLTPTS